MKRIWAALTLAVAGPLSGPAAAQATHEPQGALHDEAPGFGRTTLAGVAGSALGAMPGFLVLSLGGCTDDGRCSASTAATGALLGASGMALGAGLGVDAYASPEQPGSFGGAVAGGLLGVGLAVGAVYGGGRLAESADAPMIALPFSLLTLVLPGLGAATGSVLAYEAP